MIHTIDAHTYGNPQIAQGAFGSISIGILQDDGHDDVPTASSSTATSCSSSRTKNRPSFSFIGIKTIRNALDPSSIHDTTTSSSAERRQQEPKLSRAVFTELAALRAVATAAHENICPLLSVLTTRTFSSSSFGFGNEISFVFPYCPIDLHQIIQSHRFDKRSRRIHMDMSLSRTVLGDILCGLEHIHSLGIVHCDMKPGNILLSSRGVFQLADFGLAQLLQGRPSGIEHEDDHDHSQHSLSPSKGHWTYKQQEVLVGLCTLPYRPPEILFGSIRHLHRSSVDMWGVGLILCEMILGRALFYGVSVLDQLSKIMDVLGTPTRDSWEGLEDLPDYGKVIFHPRQGLGLGNVVWNFGMPREDERLEASLESFVSGLVVMDPKKRKSAKECLNHDWMDSRHGVWSRQEIRDKLIPQDFVSCYDGIKVHDFTNEMKEHLLEQMKLSGVEIASRKRKFRVGPSCSKDVCDELPSVQMSESFPSVFSSRLKAYLQENVIETGTLLR